MNFLESLVGRRWLAWTVLALAVVVLVLSSLTVWVKRQALDTNNWVNVSGQLLENDEVRQVVAADLVDALFANTDVQARLKEALPPRLDPLAAPAAGILRRTARPGRVRAPGAPRGTGALERGQPGRPRAPRRDPRGRHRRPDRTSRAAVILDLRPLVTQLGQRVGLQVSLPPDAGRITVLRSDQLGAAQEGVKLIRKLSVALAVLALALLALAVYLARGFRRELLRATAVSLVGVGLLLIAVQRIAGNAVIDSITSPTSTGGRVERLAAGHGAPARHRARADRLRLVLLAGVLLAGPTRWASALRGRLAPRCATTSGWSTGPWPSCS